ncbi:MAG TPA: alpha/beta hydrolase [Rubrivivax sp.]|nr:alpha/beta hydrolase [Rubrivivax sp.]
MNRIHSPDRLRLSSGLHLEYVEQGARGGPTLLLLHGITDSWRSFEPVLPQLPSHWHVLALTQRGHGGSDKPEGAYRTRDFAADAAEFVQALALPPVVLVGHSMGAANAMRTAIDHPSLVRGLVAAGAFASFGDKPELAEFVRTTIAPLTDPVPRELAQAFQQDTLARPLAPGLMDTAVSESLRVPAHVWRAAFAALFEDDFSAELQRIAAPTLLVQGEADAFVTAADTQRLLQAIPQARASVWAGAGHAMHWEDPAPFAEELVRFVSGLEC